jgi:hypothetical protein
MSASFWAAALMPSELLSYLGNNTVAMSINRRTGWMLQKTLTNSGIFPLGESVGMSDCRRSDDN